MSGSSLVPKIAGALIAVAIIAAVFFAARLVVDPSTASELYTQVDNAAMVREGSEYEYTLPAYDEGGGERETTFKASKKLREGAYLKLDVMLFRGVVTWEEVQADEIPQAARNKLEDRS